MWTTKLVFVGLIVSVVTVKLDLDKPLENDDIINDVNNAKTTWTAGRNFHQSLKKNYVKNLLGMKKRPGGSRLPEYVPDEDMGHLELPTNFDLRTVYPNCTGLQTIRDQGPCGGCWAASSASSFTDRLCIASKGSWNGQLSAENLLSCCSVCGDGCYGGFPDVAWDYFSQAGLVTGGDFKSHENHFCKLQFRVNDDTSLMVDGNGKIAHYKANIDTLSHGCQPYTLPPCEHDMSGTRKNCSDYHKNTPKCRSFCYNKKYSTKYRDDLHFVTKNVFSLTNLTKAMQEIYKHGPVVAGFDVYADFLSYKFGVYQHVSGDYEGGHAVKVIGWGVENGTEYWLVENSWNYDWGDNGLFKIRRGVNECNFEQGFYGGTPELD